MLWSIARSPYLFRSHFFISARQREAYQKYLALVEAGKLLDKTRNKIVKLFTTQNGLWLALTQKDTVCPKLFGTPKMYQNGPQMSNYCAQMPPHTGLYIHG